MVRMVQERDCCVRGIGVRLSRRVQVARLLERTGRWVRGTAVAAPHKGTCTHARRHACLRSHRTPVYLLSRGSHRPSPDMRVMSRGKPWRDGGETGRTPPFGCVETRQHASRAQQARWQAPSAAHGARRATHLPWPRGDVTQRVCESCSHGAKKKSKGKKNVKQRVD